MNLLIKINRLSVETWIIIIIGVSFFIGIWHALPLRYVIVDEMYYVGGVMHAMEQHSLFPQGADVPYGTLTFYLNYMLIGFALLFLVPFFHFNLSVLKLKLVISPEIISWIPRLTSVLVAFAYLFLFTKFLKEEINDRKTRIALMVLLFTNMITAIILHTGKMWVLSTFFIIFSFYHLYQAVRENTQEVSAVKRHILLSVLPAFFAFANFPLAGFALIDVPILIFFFRHKRALLFALFRYAATGIVLFSLITLANLGGIISQIVGIRDVWLFSEEALARNLTALQSLVVHIEKIIVLFPLTLLVLFVSLRKGIKNKILFFLALIYFTTYLLLIGLTARWAVSVANNLRYLFPAGFFLIFMIVSLKTIQRSTLFFASSISIIYFVFTLYYLSIPTTYNLANKWIVDNLNGEKNIIVVSVQELDLPKNKESWLLTSPRFCGTFCHTTINNNLNKGVQFVVVDKSYPIDNKHDFYFVEERRLSQGNRFQLLAQFISPIPDDKYYSVDYNMANYFDSNYFTIARLGKNIYIYKYKTDKK